MDIMDLSGRQTEAMRIFSGIVKKIGPEIGVIFSSITECMQVICCDMPTSVLSTQLARSIMDKQYQDVLCYALEMLRRGENEDVLLQLKHLDIDTSADFGEEFAIMKLLIVMCAMRPGAFAIFESLMEEADESSQDEHEANS